MHDSFPPKSVLAACKRLGYHVTAPENVDADAVAWPGVDAVPVPGGRRDARPMAIERVDDADPTSVLSVIQRSDEWDRSCLLVPADEATATELQSVVAPPAGVEREDERGCREFYLGADRVHLDGGGLAVHDCDRSRGRPTFEWYEEPDDDGRRLVAAADGDPIAVLDGVDALQCPGPSQSAFAHRYRREEDRLFHVYDADDREIGVFTGVTAMRDRGFHPVPAPVVPEFHLRASPGSRVALFDPEREVVTTTSGTPVSE